MCFNPACWFTGQRDTVVHPGVVQKTVDFYKHYNIRNITYVNSIMSEHAWITTSYGNPCSTLGDPYINNCSYDMAVRVYADMNGVCM